MIYYNENNKHAAQWLRNLMAAKLLPKGGVVDERSIQEVRGADVAGHKRAHFFAGIAGWEAALGLAGWDPGRPVWTGSCPCQPFSCAGKRRGTADERHLWPVWRGLIAECRPPTIFGEQVASKDGRLWLAGVRTDLEALGYAVGAADLCAASVGSPNIRQRLWWVASSNQGRQQQQQKLHGQAEQAAADGDSRGAHVDGHGVPLVWRSGSYGCRVGGMALRGGAERRSSAEGRKNVGNGADAGRQEAPGGFKLDSEDGGMASLPGQRGDGRQDSTGQDGGSGVEIGGGMGDGEAQRRGEAGPDSGGPAQRAPWSSYELIYCQDEKWRRLEPGLSPLAARIPGRVGRLRAYGNSINPYVAAVFIRSVMEALGFT